MSFTNNGEAELLDYMYERAGEIGLSSTTPTETGTGITEPSGGGYARVAVTAATWNAAVEGSPTRKANGAVVTFPTATADWAGGANMTHWVFYVGGVAKSYAALTTPKPVLSTDTASFGVDQLAHTLD